MTAAEVLTAAGQSLSSPGSWRQGKFGYAEDGSCCALTALYGVAGSACAAWPAIKAMGDMLGFEGDLVNALTEWNDAEGRTREEVVAMMLKAAT